MTIPAADLQVGTRVRLSGIDSSNPNYRNVFEVRGFVDDEVVWRLESERVGWRYSTEDLAHVLAHYELVTEVCRNCRHWSTHRGTMGLVANGREPTYLTSVCRKMPRRKDLTRYTRENDRCEKFERVEP